MASPHPHATAALALTLVSASAAILACGTSTSPAAPVDSSAPPQQDAALCGLQGQACCAGSTCDTDLACSNGTCGAPPPPADAAPDGCGAFVACHGSCADLASDPSNCGACAHSCGAAECVGGICSPSLVASGLSGAKRMALDATSVYWTNSGDGTVRTVSKQGGMIGVLASQVPSLYGIAVDATSVYFTSEGTAGATFTDGSVLKVPNLKVPPAGGSKPFVLAKGRKRPRALRIDSVNVTWLDHGIDVADGAALQCPLGGCGATTPNLVAAQLQTPYGLAIDTKRIYYTQQGAGAVMMVALTGGVPLSLAQGQEQPSGIAIDGTQVFWANLGDGSVASSPFTVSGGATPVAQVQGFPQDVATDGTFVYFTDTQTVPGEGAVMRCPVAGCSGPPLVLAANVATALDLAVDQAFVYWLGSDGTLMRAAK